MSRDPRGSWCIKYREVPGQLKEHDHRLPLPSALLKQGTFYLPRLRPRIHHNCLWLSSQKSGFCVRVRVQGQAQVSRMMAVDSIVKVV